MEEVLTQHPPGSLQRRSLQCGACGYGIVSALPPERCPMCHGEAAWVHPPWRPFDARVRTPT